jgi:hypothetical protein
MRRLLALALLASSLPAQAPRDASAFPSRVALGDATLAAEYLVHSLPTPYGSLFTENYLVVETALFSQPRTLLKLSAAHFALRIDGKKTPLLPQNPAWVAATLVNPHWSSAPRITGGAGIGNAGVIFGQPRVERFPGDPTTPRQPLPAPVPTRVEKDPPPPVEDQIRMVAFPESERELPASGLLFFAFKGKAEKIKSVELLYDGPAGKAALKLQ